MSFNGLKFQYGNYKHLSGEVYPARIEIQPLISDRGVPFARQIRMQVAGDLFPPDGFSAFGVDEVGEKIGVIDDAYLYDYQDFGFLYEDDSRTPHYYENDFDLNLSGNQIYHRSWDYQTTSEFANTRSFSMTLGCTLLASYSNVISFQETISSRGTGGPTWEIYNSWDNVPYKEFITDNSYVNFVQQGTIIGLTGYAIPPAPWWPNDEMQWLRRITRVSPRHWGHLSFNRRTHYALNYAYFFRRLGPDNSVYPTTYVVP